MNRDHRDRIFAVLDTYPSGSIVTASEIRDRINGYHKPSTHTVARYLVIYGAVPHRPKDSIREWVIP